MFLDLFYGLRDEGVPVAIQEWLAFLAGARARAPRLEPAALLPPGARLPGEERDLLRRLRPGVRARLQGRRGRARRRRHRRAAGVAARSRRTFPSCRPSSSPSSSASRTTSSCASFLETLAEQNERHDGGNRWVGTGGRSPFGHGGTHPTGIRVGGPREEPLGDEGRRGAPVQGLPHRRRARRPPDARRAAAAAPAHAGVARRPSSTSTRRSTRPAATPARSRSCSGRRAATTCGSCC